MTYTQQGPFANGGAPALQASVFNAFDNFNLSVDAPTPTVLTGSTSGTATIYQPLSGTVKLVIVQLSNFRNGSAPAQTLAIPVPFTVTCRGWNSNMNPFQLLKSGTAQTVQQLLAFNAGADNGVSAQTTLKANWIWHCDTFIDTISFNGSQGAGVSGQLIMFGI